MAKSTAQPARAASSSAAWSGGTGRLSYKYGDCGARHVLIRGVCDYCADGANRATSHAHLQRFSTNTLALGVGCHAHAFQMAYWSVTNRLPNFWWTGRGKSWRSRYISCLAVVRSITSACFVGWVLESRLTVFDLFKEALHLKQTSNCTKTEGKRATQKP